MPFSGYGPTLHLDIDEFVSCAFRLPSGILLWKPRGRRRALICFHRETVTSTATPLVTRRGPASLEASFRHAGMLACISSQALEEGAMCPSNPGTDYLPASPRVEERFRGSDPSSRGAATWTMRRAGDGFVDHSTTWEIMHRTPKPPSYNQADNPLIKSCSTTCASQTGDLALTYRRPYSPDPTCCPSLHATARRRPRRYSASTDSPAAQTRLRRATHTP